MSNEFLKQFIKNAINDVSEKMAGKEMQDTIKEMILEGILAYFEYKNNTTNSKECICNRKY